MLCLKLGFIKDMKHQQVFSLTDQNYQSNQTRLHFNSLFEHTGSVRELYISLHFIQNKDTGGY